MQSSRSTTSTKIGYADLHMHTKLSDGNLSVEELVTLCKRKGLQCISITDHDNLDSYKLAQKPAEEAEIELIPGIEISAVWQAKDIHILGYFCDHKILVSPSTAISYVESAFSSNLLGSWIRG